MLTSPKGIPREFDLLNCCLGDLIKSCVKYLIRNRKRVACVYVVIMHAGNVRRIQEKRVNTRRSRVFYTFLEYSNISQVHYHTINAQDEFFDFFYNIRTLLHYDVIA